MNVILNVVKNLKASETVDGSASLEMLRFRSAYSANEIATSGDALLAMTHITTSF